MLNLFKSKKQPAQLPFTTDIHCHVIPGVDDGSPNAATSAELIRNMARWGIRRIIATPHVAENNFENTPDTLDPALEELQDELTRQGISMPVTRSSENRIEPFFLNQLATGQIHPLPGNYLLLENSWVQEPFQLEQTIFDIRSRGYKTILAHPERYKYYHNDLPRYDRLHRIGLLFQVNLLSLAGHYGKAEKEIAEKLIQYNLVDFLGTDLHAMRHVISIDNYLSTKDARRHFNALEGRLKNDIFN